MTEALDPVAVVTAFLDAMADGDAARAAQLIDDDIVYVNVGTPAMHGAARVRRVLETLGRPGWGFGVVVHSISADGPVVHTERTDLLRIGPVRSQFWCWGHFEVHDGRITVWRDSVDFADFTIGMLRGLAAAVVPALAPRWPSAQDPPGRRAGRGR